VYRKFLVLLLLVLCGQFRDVEPCFAKHDTREMLLDRFLTDVREKKLDEARALLKKLYESNVEHTFELMEYMRDNIKSLENLIQAYNILYEEMRPRTIYDKVGLPVN
jgi:hypothetical protein